MGKIPSPFTDLISQMSAPFKLRPSPWLHWSPARGGFRPGSPGGSIVFACRNGWLVLCFQELSEVRWTGPKNFIP